MKIALIGYGRMGRAVEEVALARGHEITARIGRGGEGAGRGDRGGGGAGGARGARPGGGTGLDRTRVAGVTEESVHGAEVAIDFSAPDATLENIRGLADLGIDVVVGTTGWTLPSLQLRRIVEAGDIGLIHSPNFSVGVHLFLRLVRLAGSLANSLEGYDPHVSETHHRHKKDHPSGTALRAAEILLDEIDRKRRWEEVGTKPGAPDAEALHIAVARVGENPGMHLVGLDGPDDRIEIRHEARGRAGFARGAVAAAEWIRGRKGLFTMDDWLGEHFEGGDSSGGKGGAGGSGGTGGSDISDKGEEK